MQSIAYRAAMDRPPPAASAPLPFRLLAPCRRNRTTTTSCLPSSTRSAQWRLPGAPLPLPRVPEAALRLACGPLRVHALSSREAILNRSFWSSWLKWDASAPPSSQARERRCVQRLRGWRPRVCEARDVWVAGAAQVMFNASGYLGPAKRVAATLQGVRGVQASREHVVLTRNEYGAGYYHVLYDTLASLAFLWPRARDEWPEAALLFNPCTTGRDHAASRRNRTVAPDFGAMAGFDGGTGSARGGRGVAGGCAARPYVGELLRLLGVRAERVQPWPYTRQLRGPALAARRATFMCAHPFHGTYHRQFWYVRQLRALLHEALGLTVHDDPAAMAAAEAAAAAAGTRSGGDRGDDGGHGGGGGGGGGAGGGRLLLLVNRNRCGARGATSGGGCDGGRGVASHGTVLAALRNAFEAPSAASASGPAAEAAASAAAGAAPATGAGTRRGGRVGGGDRVVEFSGEEPVAAQARLFHAAALVAGPHGAAFANAIFCRAGTSLLEFHRLRWEREPNSPLYAQLSRLLGLRHWVLVDASSAPLVGSSSAASAAASASASGNRSGSASRLPSRRLGPNGRPLPLERQGYQIRPQAVVDAAREALAAAVGGGGGGSTLIEIPNYIPEAEEKAS